MKQINGLLILSGIQFGMQFAESKPVTLQVTGINTGANMSIFLKTTKRNRTFFPLKHSKEEHK